LYAESGQLKERFLEDPGLKIMFCDSCVNVEGVVELPVQLRALTDIVLPTWTMGTKRVPVVLSTGVPHAYGAAAMHVSGRDGENTLR
jgi:hypothetical protein